MGATDAHPVAIRGAILRITFPILDADGDLVTGASSLDSEFSEDGAGFADCSNEATEIATSSGMYLLDLIATETDGDTVAVIVKSTEGKTTPMVIYPASTANPIDVNVQQISDDATAADNMELDYDGTGFDKANSTMGTISALAADSITSSVIAANAIGASELATDAIGAAQLAADAVDEIWNEAMSGHTTLGTFGQALNAHSFTGEVNDASATTTSFAADGFTEASDDHFNGSILTFTTGALTGQSRTITDYDAAGGGQGNQQIDVAEAWTEAPGNNDDFVIVPGPMAGGSLAVIERLFLTILNASTGQLDAGSLTAGTIDANALASDAVAEIWAQAMTETTGAPAVTASVLEAIKWMFALSRNKITQTSSTSTLRNDADAGDLSTSAVSDDATTAIRGEWST